MKEYLNGVQHIGLPTKNYEKAGAFYIGLGFDCIYETLQPNGGKVGFFKQQNLVMEIYEADETAGVDGAIEHIALDCTDIEAAFAEAQGMGLEIVSDGIEALPYWANGIRFFHVKGPDGEKIEFCEILKK